MDVGPSTSEIVEAADEIDAELKMGEPGKSYYMQKSGNKYSIEDDINRLFDAVDVRTSSRVSGFSKEMGRDALWRRAMKRPVRVGPSHASGIGISEPVSLKQALRGLSISQASEMAAMKKRLSKPAGSSGVSEAGTIRMLYRAVVVEENGSGVPLNEDKGNLVDISLVPEKRTPDSLQKMPESLQVSNKEVLNQDSGPSDNAATEKVTTRFPVADQIVHLAMESKNEVSEAQLKRLNSIDSFTVNHAAEDAMEIGCSSIPICVETPSPDKEPKGKLLVESSPPVSSAAGKLKSDCENRHLIKPVLRHKSFMRRKAKEESTTIVSSLNSCNVCFSNDLSPSTSYSDNQIEKPSGNRRKENMKVSQVSSSTSRSVEVNSSMVGTSFKSISSSNCTIKSKPLLIKTDDISRSREKGEFSQSSKSSIGEYSSSTITSEESNIIDSSRIGSRPHMSKDLRWEVIRSIWKQHGNLSLKHFKLLKKLGFGDIGTVYLAELTNTNCLFALKVMNNEFLLRH